MILALARCIFDLHCREEIHACKGRIRVFHTMGHGALERAASILERTGFTRYTDAYAMRSEFICGLSEFESLADREVAVDVSDQNLTEAVLRLADGGVCASIEIQKLAELIIGESGGERALSGSGLT